MNRAQRLELDIRRLTQEKVDKGENGQFVKVAIEVPEIGKVSVSYDRFLGIFYTKILGVTEHLTSSRTTSSSHLNSALSAMIEAIVYQVVNQSRTGDFTDDEKKEMIYAVMDFDRLLTKFFFKEDVNEKG